jgi:hypothetical protein
MAACGELDGATDTLVGEYAGEPLLVAFNHDYLVDFLALGRARQVLSIFRE